MKVSSTLPIDKLICGDAIETMKQFPGGSVDLVFTSPPYNLRNSSGNGMRDGRGGKWSRAQLLKGYAGSDDAMPQGEYDAWQRLALREMMRVIKPTGAIFYNHKWRVQDGFLQGRGNIVDNFPVRQIIIWKRKGGINFNPGYFLPTYEVIYMIPKEKFKLAPKANALGDVWEIAQERNNPHPAPFPMELAERVITSTNAKIVLDPFAGSCTVAAAAIKHGRNYICIDSSEEYIAMGTKRLNGAKWQK